MVTDNISYKTDDDYINSFHSELMKPIYEWVNGIDFIEINKMTTLYEGNLIRIIKNLRDVLKQLMDSSKAIGNDQLSKKLKISIEILQRGIVFAASLYVDDLDDDDENENENEESDDNEDNEDNENNENEQNVEVEKTDNDNVDDD